MNFACSAKFNIICAAIGGGMELINMFSTVFATAYFYFYYYYAS